jgi:coupling of ubiquitin conjugation to ER degradation protein 1
MSSEQVSLPSVVVLLVLGGLAIRYLFFSTPSSAPQPRDPASASRTREAAVQQLQQMFPQVDRRTLLWDLQRTGGNMAATTERVLAGRLETVRSPFSLFFVCVLSGRG